MPGSDTGDCETLVLVSSTSIAHSRGYPVPVKKRRIQGTAQEREIYVAYAKDLLKELLELSSAVTFSVEAIRQDLRLSLITKVWLAGLTALVGDQCPIHTLWITGSHPQIGPVRLVRFGRALHHSFYGHPACEI